MNTNALRDYMRAALVENLGLKLVSLFCALALYAFIHGAGGDAQRTISVGVVVIRPPDNANRELLTQPPTEVNLTLRGPRAQLDDLHGDDIGSLQIDLKNGTQTHIDLDPSMFHIPFGLRVVQIIPSSIKLKWDDVIERPIPVQIARTGEPAFGFVVKGSLTSDPPQVLAHGPRSQIEVMQFARTTPFDVTGLTEGTRRPLELEKPQSLVTFDVDRVMGSVEVVRDTKTLPFPHLKVEVVGITRATTVPQYVTVKVTGTPEEVNSVIAEAIVPHVDPKAVGADVSKPNSVLLDVVVDMPKMHVDVEPKQVLVKW